MKNHPNCFVLIALLLWSMTGNGAAAQSDERAPFPLLAIITGAKKPDVHYVPTPMSVVAKMLDMAQVNADDVIYDLGCGDGRIVITAAKERGARGIGIDIDPLRIRESRLNAKDANVTDRVLFKEQDLFTTDFSDASVVSLYLLQRLNLELRPKLLDELKPGSRIVSHAFTMGEWEPDRSAMVNGNSVYYWVVPANVSGAWEWSAAGTEGLEHYRLDLTQEFQKVDGTLIINDSASMQIENAKIVGERLEFTVQRQMNGRTVQVRYEGHAQANLLLGSRITEPKLVKDVVTWQAKRDPASIAPLDGGVPRYRTTQAW